MTKKLYRIGYLRGIFDAKGCISIQGKIIIRSLDEKLIGIIERYLIELGFYPFRNIDDNGMYGIFICARKEVMKFYEMIGTNIERKKERFESLKYKIKDSNDIYRDMTEEEKLTIEKAVKRTVKEYGETLRLLGKHNNQERRK